MRDVIRFFVRFYWEDSSGTLLGSIIVLLISLFFANFEQILPLYDPVVTNVPNSHPGIMGIFQAILWPAIVSTFVSIVISLIKLVIYLRAKKAGGVGRDLPSTGPGPTE